MTDKITGYRQQPQEVIDLINKVKEHEERTKALATIVGKFAGEVGDQDAGRWASVAATHLETGFMFLVKTVARPEAGIGRRAEQISSDDRDPARRALDRLRGL